MLPLGLLVQALPDAPPDLLHDGLARQQGGEDDDEVGLALDDDDEVVPDLEAAEGLVDEHVADLLGGDEARGARGEVAPRAAAHLDAEAAQDEQRLRGVGAQGQGAEQGGREGGEGGGGEGGREAGDQGARPGGVEAQEAVAEGVGAQDRVEGLGGGAGEPGVFPAGVQDEEGRDGEGQAGCAEDGAEDAEGRRRRGQGGDGELGRRGRGPADAQSGACREHFLLCFLNFFFLKIEGVEREVFARGLLLPRGADHGW